jgi:hypothetical protein
MEKHPERIKPLDPDVRQRIDSLVGRVKADPDEDLGDSTLL